jgi:hypothetical protein
MSQVGVNTKFGGGNPFMQSIVEAQRKLATTAKNIEYVDSVGCNLANEARFSSKGTLELCTRFAESLIQAEESPRKE